MNFKYTLLAFFILIIILTANTCLPNTVWNIAVDDLREKIKKSDYSFLKEGMITRTNLNEVMKLGPGASYYFYYIFLKAGYKDHALQMLLMSFEKERKIFSQEAGIILLRNLLKEEDYETCENRAKLFLKKHGKSDRGNEGRKILIEAIYWQKKDSEVLATLNKYYPDVKKLLTEEPELILFRAVALSRLKKIEWHESFRQLFIEVQNYEIIKRAHDYIMGDEALYNTFNDEMKHFILAKNMLGLGNTSLALPLIEMFIKKLDFNMIQTSSIIKELGFTYFSANEYRRGADFLSSLSKKCTGKNKLDALEMAGRLYRKNEQYQTAIEHLKKVSLGTDNSDQRDRAVWFLLDCVQELSPEEFVYEVQQYAPGWNDPTYFDDVLEKEIAELISLKKWQKIKELHTVLKNYISNKIDSCFCLIRARMLSLGYLKPESGSHTKEIETFLKKATSVQGVWYTGFFASALLGETPDFLKHTQKKKNIRSNSFSGVEELISGFFDYSLPLEGYAMVSEKKEALGEKLLSHAARLLSEQECESESLLVMAYNAYQRDYKLTIDEMQYLYPLAYSTIIEENGKKQEIENYLLYALIREESAFDPSIVSSAGAVGLSQLMPETAADLAGWMRMKNYDLYDPETNITLGAYYFARLFRLLENLPKTLIAYNAGLGRLRKWEKTYRGFTDDFFVELLPYKETRGYVKKIIASTIVYAYLYWGKKPHEIFALIYPGLFKSGQ
jgi:soluble lytic murein transglycosylase